VAGAGPDQETCQHQIGWRAALRRGGKPGTTLQSRSRDWPPRPRIGKGSSATRSPAPLLLERQCARALPITPSIRPERRRRIAANDRGRNHAPPAVGRSRLRSLRRRVRLPTTVPGRSRPLDFCGDRGSWPHIATRYLAAQERGTSTRSLNIPDRLSCSPS
jgi:hypothetical protein